MLKLILAIDEANLVGDSSARFGLPWHYPEDLKFFKKTTLNQTILMGRKTLDILKTPLPDRQTIVLTKNLEYQNKQVIVEHDYQKIINLSKKQDVYICGGVSIYKLFNQYADQILITKIAKRHTGDAYYHDLDLTNYTLIKSEPGTNQELTFQTWECKCK